MINIQKKIAARIFLPSFTFQMVLLCRQKFSLVWGHICHDQPGFYTWNLNLSGGHLPRPSWILNLRFYHPFDHPEFWTLDLKLGIFFSWFVNYNCVPGHQILLIIWGYLDTIEIVMMMMIGWYNSVLSDDIRLGLPSLSLITSNHDITLETNMLMIF